MVKSRASLKRLSTTSQSTLTKGIDAKARQRIEDLFELTDEIINAYNEINEKYVHQIYRKYQQLKEKCDKLQTQLAHHHCIGCPCDRTTTTPIDPNPIDTNETTKTLTTDSIVTRSKKNNPFIIADIDETQNSNHNANRFLKFDDDDDEEEEDEEDNENDRHFKVKKRRNDDDDDEGQYSPDEAEAEEKSDEDEESNTKEAQGNKNEPNAHDNEIVRLPLALKTIIQRKTEKSLRKKDYLLELVRFPDLCAYLQDRSRRSFDLRPSEDLVRPFVAKYVHPHGNTDGKFRMRIRDELREIHRSYLRTFMYDPHSVGGSLNKKSTRSSPLKKSPL